MDITQPTSRMDQFQATQTVPGKKQGKQRRWILWITLILLVYLVAPFRTNILFLVSDDSPDRGSVGRTDTIILTTIQPLKPYIGMLSIPRDLWVQVPGVGEQRINTAYFFSEANLPGSGAEATMNAIEANFEISVHYYVLIHMVGLESVIDSIGGVDVKLDSPSGNLAVGTHHLNGTEALAFARDRSIGDDFGRMGRTQVLITAVLEKALQPSSWPALPQLVFSITQTVDTNVPFWQWPRLLFALVRAPLFGIDNQTITREMVTPFQTSQGAQVLLPNWDAINPLLKDMFGR